MSEILTTLWLNIEKFHYPDKKKISIDKDDIRELSQMRTRFLVKPGVCLFFTLLFSRYRLKIWGFTKNYFIGNRKSVNTYKEIKEVKETLNEKVVIEYKSETPYDVDGSNKLALSMSRKISGRRIKNNPIDADASMNQTRVFPTYREEYLGFLDKHRETVKKLIVFKQLSSKLTSQDKVFKSGENFLMKTKLIFLPFVLVVIFSLYDLVLTYIGLYLKYQPLVDEFYSQSNNNSLKKI